MYLFDKFNALQILKSFNTFCATHPYCKCCPFYVKREEKCVFQLCGKDRTDWQNNLEGRIREQFEDTDE